MTKEILAIPMLLCPYDHSRKLVLTWDSSDEGIGALLCHVGDDEQLELIAFASRTTRPKIHKDLLLSWNLPANLWPRIHLDIAGPMNGQLYLVAVDARSKWP
ncbi:hypothetical protein GJ496_003511 [Pomphorhynchus laevis]|nr:hypothetical protein GJ496_003511 [Pomphorhynchus laevis]